MKALFLILGGESNCSCRFIFRSQALLTHVQYPCVPDDLIIKTSFEGNNIFKNLEFSADYLN